MRRQIYRLSADMRTPTDLAIRCSIIVFDRLRDWTSSSFPSSNVLQKIHFRENCFKGKLLRHTADVSLATSSLPTSVQVRDNTSPGESLVFPHFCAYGQIFR